MIGTTGMCLAGAFLLAWGFFGGASSKGDAALIRKSVSNEVERAVNQAAAAAAERAAKWVAEQKADIDAKLAAEKAAREAAKAEFLEKRAFAKEDREVAEKTEAEKKAEQQEEMRRIESRMFKLQHASAEEVAAQFNAMWSGDFGEKWKITKMAVSFPESNTIMMTAPHAIILACERALKELDVEAPQVYIEARFVELGNSASHKVGIDWTLLDGLTLAGSVGAGINATTIGDGVTDYTKNLVDGKNSESYKVAAKSIKETTDATGSKVVETVGGNSGSVSYFNGTLNLSQMSMTLKLLDSTGDTKTFSNPKIIVSSGKKATVDMTTKYPNVKISTKRTTGTSDSVDIASNLEAIPGEDKFMFAKEAFFSWGISLDVTPRIATNGLINVAIVPTISSLDGWVETGTTDTTGGDSGTVSTKYPQIKVQRLITEFNLASGMTAVIGGLWITEESQRDTGIPVLREIPWIGTRWFGSMERVKEQKEIIVFVTVGLVDPRKIKPDAGLPKNAVLGRQYTQGQKLEPGDRPQRNMEGFQSLDLRPLDEQAEDPLMQKKPDFFNFSDYMPFTKEDKKAEKNK